MLFIREISAVALLQIDIDHPSGRGWVHFSAATSGLT